MKGSFESVKLMELVIEWSIKSRVQYESEGSWSIKGCMGGGLS